MVRVFIIGHNLLIRTLLREVLIGEGHEIVGEGEEGPETLDRVLRLRPQLVILDVVLVRSDGLSTLESRRRIDPEMGVVVCSALVERRNAIAALQRGANAFIVKPFDRQTVIDVAHQALTHAYGDRTVAKLPERTAASSAPRTRVEEQRDFLRQRAALPVVVTPVGGEPIETVTSNISGGGMLLATALLAVGAAVEFRLTLGPGEAPVAGRARVVRISLHGEAALQFEQVSIADHERLTDYIAASASSA